MGLINHLITGGPHIVGVSKFDLPIPRWQKNHQEIGLFASPMPLTGNAVYTNYEVSPMQVQKTIHTNTKNHAYKKK
jgi:hypothetical protein